MEVDADRNQAAAAVTHMLKEKFPHSQETANIPLCVWALHNKVNPHTHYAGGVDLDPENKKVNEIGMLVAHRLKMKLPFVSFTFLNVTNAQPSICAEILRFADRMCVHKI